MKLKIQQITILLLFITFIFPFTIKAQESIELQKAEIIHEIIKELEWADYAKNEQVIITVLNPSSAELIKQLNKVTKHTADVIPCYSLSKINYQTNCPHVIYIDNNISDFKTVFNKIKGKPIILITNGWGDINNLMVDLYTNEENEVHFVYDYLNIEKQKIEVPYRFTSSKRTKKDHFEYLQALKREEDKRKEDEEAQTYRENESNQKDATIRSNSKKIIAQEHRLEALEKKRIKEVEKFEKQKKEFSEKRKKELDEYTEKIESKEAELKKSNYKVMVQRYALSVFIFLLLVIIILLFFIFKNLKLKKKQNALLIEKNEEINAQSDELETINKELEKLSIVASGTNNAIAILDKEGNFEWLNRGYTKLYGYTIQLLINELGENIKAVSSHSEIEILLKECITNKKPVLYETFSKTRDGSKLFAQTSLSPILNNNNEITKLVLIDSDITKIKEAKEQIKQQNDEIITINEDLHQQKEELQTTLNNLKKTQTQLVQSEKMASLGKLIANIAHELNTPLGAINSSIGSLDASSKKTMELLPKLIQKLSAEQFKLFNELILVAVNNTEYYTSREARKIKRKLKKELRELSVNNSDYIADILIDINIYKDVEKFILLYNSQNQKLIMETAYNVVTQSNIQNNMKTAINRASKTILALKSYSHTTIDDEKIKTDIPKSIDSVLTIYRTQLKHGIEIIKNYEQIPEILCYPDKINQIWTNIVQNAVQAMNLKGKLNIAIAKDGEFVKISFSDNGPGIPEEYKDKIFEPFFTTKATGEGTGLGLDIIKKIIDTHNGKITFESEIGKGTTFFVYLPIL